MSGITIGGQWADHSAHKNLRIEPFVPGAAHFAALTTIINETRGSDLTVEQVLGFYAQPAFELARDARLVFLGSRPVAAAIIYPTIHFHDHPPGNFEIFVVPDAGGHGLGSRLLAHLAVAARARGHRVLETTLDARQQDDGRGFLVAHGFHAVGQTAHLTRSGMADLPSSALPEGFSLSDLDELGGDPDLYRETCNRLGAHDEGYELIEPEELAQTVASAAWEPRGILFLLDPQQRLVGVIRASGAGGEAGYLHEIRLEPTYRGQRLATAMVGAALRYLAANGVKATDLDTEGVGTAPYRLAERAGFEETHRWVRFIKGLET